jgi:hypothetical protein
MGFKRKSIIFKSDKLGFQRRKRTEARMITHFPLLHGAKRSKTTAPSVSHSRQAVEDDRLKKNFLCPFKIKLNWNFVLTLESIPCKFQQNPSQEVAAA